MGTLELKVFYPSFMTQVNGQNVVKVGHRQVVNMIRQGGNTLMVKVVMVTRHPDMDEAVHKKGTSLLCFSCVVESWPGTHRALCSSPKAAGRGIMVGGSEVHGHPGLSSEFEPAEELDTNETLYQDEKGASAASKLKLLGPLLKTPRGPPSSSRPACS